MEGLPPVAVDIQSAQTSPAGSLLVPLLHLRADAFPTGRATLELGDL